MKAKNQNRLPVGLFCLFNQNLFTVTRKTARGENDESIEEDRVDDAGESDNGDDNTRQKDCAKQKGNFSVTEIVGNDKGFEEVAPTPTSVHQYPPPSVERI